MGRPRVSFFAGRTGHPLLEKIVDALYRRHLCRVAPYPSLLDESMAIMALPVYNSI
jgi:hypothetical protein